MDMQFTRPTTIRGVKRLAKKLVAESGIPHTRALEVVSRTWGFENYRHACRMLENELATSPAFEVIISYRWRDKETGARGRETYRHTLSSPLRELVSPYQMGVSNYLRGFKFVASDHIVQDHDAHSQAYARSQIFKAARTLDFMAATGLKPSNANSRAYYRGSFSNMFAGIDHAHVWLDPIAKQYIVIDEPYGPFDRQVQERAEWAERTGWQVVRSPWNGMYWPDGRTIMYLSTDVSRGYSLQPFIKALANMPEPLVEMPWNGVSGPYHVPFVSPVEMHSR